MHPGQQMMQNSLLGIKAGLVDVQDGDLPVSTAAAREVLCLPVFPELTNEEVEAVCAAIRGFYGS